MGSFFAGLLRSPIAAVLIVIELTRDYELVVPLMLAVTIGVAVSRRLSPRSIVEQQMVDEGWIEALEEMDPLAGLRVSSVMSTNVITLRKGEAFDAAREVHRMYPIVDERGALAGIALPGGDIEYPEVIAVADERLLDVIERMQFYDVERCVVIADRATRRVVGFLSPLDILRARMRG